MQKKNLLSSVKATISVFIFCFTTNITYSQPQISFQPVITSDLSLPMEVVTAPGDPAGRFFIVQKGGIIRIWNGSALLPTPFLNISASIVSDGERGLLSMAFHPQYQSNGLFYLYYNNPSGNITVSRFQVSADPDIANATATPLVSIPKPFGNHNGGHLHFKPEGGINYLYFATGDGGSGNDPFNNAQNPASLLGKMLRIDADAATPTPEVWAWGLRNPFRWSFDRATGDMWIGDVGQGLWEEVNYRAGGTYGANYGWACFEALVPNTSAPATADCDSVDNVHVLPAFEYNNPPSGSSSVVGGYVYRGTEFPTLQGFYMTVDFYSGQLWLIESAGPGAWNVSTQTGLPVGVSSLSETNDGSTIYATSMSLVPTGIDAVYKVVVPVVTPLTLINFSGKDGTGYVDLKWVAESEVNIEKYVVEYSADANTYSAAGVVAAVNNGSRNTYSFRHFIAASSKLYYRLRMEEQDGSFRYSPIITVRGEDRLIAKVYPTIVSGNRINVISGKPVFKITMLGADGRQVMAKNMSGTEGYFTVELPVLTKGIYFLQINGADFQQTEKLIVQ